VRPAGAQLDAWHRVVLGYGGFWFVRGEAHISTIATHPLYRGMGLGELLLASMIRRGLNMGAQVLSLEVRVSNEPAIALYHKYQFAEFGIKTKYYRDNREDAYDLRVSPVTPGYHTFFAERWTALAGRLHYADQFTAVRPPR
jgi:ribosomal-protein-alanine N-acetyltransferase